MATGQTLIDDVRRILADTTDLSFPDDDMIVYLNEAIERFATETHCNQAQISYTATGNKVTYATLLTALGSSVGKKILHIPKIQLAVGSEYVNLPKALISESFLLQAATVLVPTRFALFAETVLLDLHPSVSGASNAMIFHASYVPAVFSVEGDLSVNLANDILIPEEWQVAIKEYMKFCCYQVQRDTGLANGAFNSYEILRVRASEQYLIRAE